MRIISSTEFRDNQALYLDQVDKGEEILVQRGKTKSYKIVPVTEFDTVIGKEFILEPDDDLETALSAEQFVTRAIDHLHKLYSQKR